MKKGQSGYTLVELLMAVAIMAVIGATAAMTINQVSKGTRLSNDSVTTVRQVQNAGYWIATDVLKANSVIVDDLTAPEFLIINWIEWDQNDNPIYHTATYLIEDLNNGAGTLTRDHWSSDGLSQQTIIAEHLYYQPGDIDNTSAVHYSGPQVTLKLTAIFKDSMERREYVITRRPNF